MRLISVFVCFLAALLNTPLVAAERLIESKALNLCQDSNNFTATYFHVRYTPNNNSLVIAFDGVSAISGFVEAEVILDAYGYVALRQTFDPCEMDFEGLCPMNTGAINVRDLPVELPDDINSNIPGTLTEPPSQGMYVLSLTLRNSRHCIHRSRS
jgi:hypothetical protein